MGVFAENSITSKLDDKLFNLRYRFAKVLLPDGLEIQVKPAKRYLTHIDLNKGTDYVYSTDSKTASSPVNEQV